jgi:hypothetical protein
VRHLCSSGSLEKLRGVVEVEVIVILHRQRCEGLVWYAMAQEWPWSYEQRLIARGAITRTCVTRRDASRSTIIVFIDSSIDTSINMSRFCVVLIE